METFFGLVSKSNGNSFFFGNMFPNQLPLWILLAGIHSGLVTIGNTLCDNLKFMFPHHLTDGAALGRVDHHPPSAFPLWSLKRQRRVRLPVLRPHRRLRWNLSPIYIDQSYIRRVTACFRLTFRVHHRVIHKDVRAHHRLPAAVNPYPRSFLFQHLWDRNSSSNTN